MTPKPLRDDADVRAARERIEELEKAVEHLHGMIERQDALADKGMAYERKLEDWIERAVKVLEEALPFLDGPVRIGEEIPGLYGRAVWLLREREGK